MGMAGVGGETRSLDGNLRGRDGLSSDVERLATCNQPDQRAIDRERLKASSEPLNE